MKEFACPDVGITIHRGVLDSFVAAFGAYKARGEKVLARNLGVATISADPEARFPLVGFLAAMAELQEQFGGAFMRKVGAFIIDKVVMPPGLDSAAKQMETISHSYYMNHSPEAKGRIGQFAWTPSGTRGGTMKVDTPYPCAFDIGTLETTVRRYESTGKLEHLPGSCRHHGDDFCAYTLEW